MRTPCTCVGGRGEGGSAYPRDRCCDLPLPSKVGALLAPRTPCALCGGIAIPAVLMGLRDEVAPSAWAGDQKRRSAWPLGCLPVRCSRVDLRDSICGVDSSVMQLARPSGGRVRKERRERREQTAGGQTGRQAGTCNTPRVPSAVAFAFVASARALQRVVSIAELGRNRRSLLDARRQFASGEACGGVGKDMSKYR